MTQPTIPAKTKPAPPVTFESKCLAVEQDYMIKFKGEVLRSRVEDNALVILFVDGRKFYFPIPSGWSK
jgi:hypothetical protein